MMAVEFNFLSIDILSGQAMNLNEIEYLFNNVLPPLD